MEPVRIIKKDMFNIKITKEYKVYLLNTININKYPNYFDDFMLAYDEKTKDSAKKFYICIDCEFNTKKIALIQINFEEDNDGNIFILDPKILSKKTLEILTYNILCNYRISKIFHGADSLDIPYFFNDYFLNNKELISKFMNNFVDTRFLCEYANAYNKLYKNSDDNLCGIYHLYEKYQIINSEHVKYLDENEKIMGHLYDIFIEIDKLSDELLNYTMYDVVYLKYLYKRMISDIGKEYHYVNEMVQLVYLDKRDIIKFVEKDKIDKYNINYYFKDNKIIRLSEIIEKNKIFEKKLTNIFYTLYHVNYFKLNLNMMLKNILYAKILRREKVFENKNTKQNNYINYNELFEKLKEHKLNNILDLIKDVEL